MTDIPKVCATCEWWWQASTEAFQNPLEGIWGLCRVNKVEGVPKVMLLTASGFYCEQWELD